MRLFKRIINLLLFPAKEWQEIAVENHSRKTVYLKFMAPLLCATSISVMAGACLYLFHELRSVVFWVATLCSSFSAGCFLSAFFVTEIMGNELGKREHRVDFALMAYSLGAAFIVVIIVFLSPFREFVVLALYSCYLYWQGIPHMVRIEGQKQIKYALVSLFVSVLIFSLVFFLFGKIFSALLF